MFIESASLPVDSIESIPRDSAQPKTLSPVPHHLASIEKAKPRACFHRCRLLALLQPDPRCCFLSPPLSSLMLDEKQQFSTHSTCNSLLFYSQTIFS
ncbi:hypothetical protein SETIT_3G365800v2 [Setaria italica]|uniref:Uncharacterized protein n=2 Tax=Setaria TaxID=4554 RepID=A0A368QN92_SETIT|nr:hypothetical protein SETIT_3G365800v2 [Setaria italica]TKW29237.1 hypothetical protein SEVIR_3G383100v2 [Setaria viridis]